MPFKSEKQRKFLWAKEPAIARRWAHKYGSKVRESAKGNQSMKAIRKVARGKSK